MDTLTDSMAWLAKRDGTMVIGHGPFTEAATPPSDGIAFYVQTFALEDPKPWKIPNRIERTHVDSLPSKIPYGPNMECTWTAPQAGDFSIVFQEIMAAIHSGVFEKTVPVVTELGTAQDSQAFAISRAMMRQTAPLHSYGWIQPESGFAGATPELLFSLCGNHLETMALAGTARSEDLEVFAVDEKEIREHEYVAQTLLSKLLDLGDPKRHSREILDLGSIVHFLSLINLDLAGPISPELLIRRLHPTPALGPLPRTPETLALLFEWRNRLRCPPEFGAPFGLWDHGDFTAVVAIRGIWWNENQLRLPAGCGIIEPSRLINEWRELRLKREAVKLFLV